jgi:hypothetical protein
MGRKCQLQQTARSKPPPRGSKDLKVLSFVRAESKRTKVFVLAAGERFDISSIRDELCPLHGSNLTVVVYETELGPEAEAPASG